MLVAESIEAALKPKELHDIDKEIDQIIDNFVNTISIRDLEDELLLVNSHKEDTRKLKQNGKVTYIASPESLYELVDSLAAREKDLGSSTTLEFLYKFPEFHELWMNLQANDNNLEWLHKQVANKVIEKIAKKFNIEY